MDSGESEKMRRSRKGVSQQEVKKATYEEAVEMLNEMAKTKKEQASTSTSRRLSGRGKQIDDAVNSNVKPAKRRY